MQFKIPVSIMKAITEESTDTIVDKTKFVDGTARVLIESLPPLVNVYAEHVAHADRFIGLLKIVKTNWIVLKKCMQITDGKLIVFCVATTAVCALTIFPGFQRSEV